MVMGVRGIFSRGSRQASASASAVANVPDTYPIADFSALELGRLLETLTGLVTLTPAYLRIIMEQKGNNYTPVESITLDAVTSASPGAEEHATSNADTEKRVTEMSIPQCVEEIRNLASEIKWDFEGLIERQNGTSHPTSGYSVAEGKPASTLRTKRVHPRLKRLWHLTSRVLDHETELQRVGLSWRTAVLQCHVWYTAFELCAWQQVTHS
ncbi:hypothetical protein QFC24_002984 [Naganishia onofrii]|uniref:Uncharacterized protein n=1 Tax=Naganishia onofrii TaxID=1851511 RepID=A0ACC2XMY2_9TREE|nr:hypothetical protein QFC24_002984 [Naganishia onofrii]